MVRIPRPPLPHTGPKPGVKVDARSERWREHRKKVRAEIVEAAFRAIDRLGPDLSVREIAEEAGTAKPKIYRHFTDKSDLFQAIGERLRDMLWAAVFPSIDFATDSVREIIHRSAEEHVSLVDEHPNVLRFFIQGRFPEQSESTMRTVNEGREITLAMAEMFNNELREMELDPAAFELAAFAAYGCAAAATDWWLGSDAGSPRRMPRELFVEHLTTITLGVICGTAEMLGIKLDPDKPIHDAMPHSSAAS
ncbi:MAG TPA: TetR/AcrR family transcriptional regulator [Mycobacterium sp.]|uniref:TetR/AcrR family transcriptional regulator n=1 Tax=Mycobacterium sp. TaxID=1785 RepID=UPI002CCEF533|nr:TetR/AcrR family transcriptional regulator [Mycobacterium sp.]HXO83126.1 TetR/AcrR family transcriptional regulator [Mycobacterium sp.]